MFFVTSKILAFLFNPLTWIAILFLIYLIVKKRKSKIIALSSLIILSIVFSNPFLTEEVYRMWEPKSKPDKTYKIKYEAAIVLGGGMINYDQRNDKLICTKSTDRFLQAMHLFSIGKIKKIIISGGNGNLEEPELYSEAELVRRFMLENGIPDSAIIVETKSRNTHENAGFTKQIMIEHKIAGPCLLLTSAYHLPRAHKCFTKEKINVEDYPCDQLSGPRHFEIYHLLVPQAQDVMQWDMLIHEWVGYISYKISGYL